MSLYLFERVSWPSEKWVFMPIKMGRGSSEAHHASRKSKAKVSFNLSEEILHWFELISGIKLTETVAESLIRLLKESKGVHNYRLLRLLMLQLLFVVLINLFLATPYVEIVFPREKLETITLTSAQGFPSVLCSRNFLEPLQSRCQTQA